MPTDKTNLFQAIKAIYGQIAQGVVRSLNNVLEPAIELSHTVVKTKDQEKAQRGYERLCKTLCHIKDIIQPLIALDEEPVGEERLLSLSAQVTDFASVVKDMVREDISVTISKETTQSTISSYPYGLKLIVTALVLRAQEMLPLGGKMNIKTEDVDIEDQLAYHFGGLTPGSYSVLTLEASGSSSLSETDEEEAALITEQELRTFVYSFGGAHFEVSDKDASCTFSVYFPRCEELATSTEKPGVVLVCDDNECVVELTQHFLEDGGYHVLPTTAPDEALDIIDKHRGTVDLCILDIVMPSMSGPALFKCLRTIQPDLRVVFSSGYDKIPSISRRIPEGAFFLSKPMKEEELLKIVGDAIAAPVPGE